MARVFEDCVGHLFALRPCWPRRIYIYIHINRMSMSATMVLALGMIFGAVKKQICEKYGVGRRDRKNCTSFTHLFVGRPGTGTLAEGTQVIPTSASSVPRKRRRIVTKSHAGVFDSGFAL